MLSLPGQKGFNYVTTSDYMVSVSRRRLLQAFGGISLASLAGCANFDDASEKRPRLRKLTAMNRDPNPHTVHVRILEDDTPLYRATKQLPSTEIAGVPGVVFEGYPTDPGNYVLQVRLSSHPQSEWKTYAFQEFDTDCLKLTITVDTPPRHAGYDDDINLGYVLNPSPCGVGASTS